MKRFSLEIEIWLVAFAVCAAVAAFCFVEIDVWVVHRLWSVGRHLSPLSTAFGAKVILTLEALVVVSLIVARLLRGHISRFAEAVGLACLASICAYGINDQILKPLFGVEDPVAIMQGAKHVFHLASGLATGSFPSGHMVLAGAFVGVFMRLYKASVGLLSGLLLLAAALLVIGGWHFVSDVIMGAFLGLSAGILAAEAWAVHMMGSRYGQGER